MVRLQQPPVTVGSANRRLIRYDGRCRKQAAGVAVAPELPLQRRSGGNGQVAEGRRPDRHELHKVQLYQLAQGVALTEDGLSARDSGVDEEAGRGEAAWRNPQAPLRDVLGNQPAALRQAHR